MSALTAKFLMSTAYRPKAWTPCTNKESFPTYALAIKTAKEQMYNAKGNATAYQCPLCHQFHWGKWSQKP